MRDGSDSLFQRSFCSRERPLARLLAIPCFRDSFLFAEEGYLLFQERSQGSDGHPSSRGMPVLAHNEIIFFF